MANWLTYIKERFPLPVYALLVGGICCSGSLIALGTIGWKGFLISFVGIMLFFFNLRLMDELKDYEKDLIVHPERPLPRGVLKVEEVRRTIRNNMLFMGVLGSSSFVTGSDAASLMYLTVTGWLWLMYKEFYLGEWLVKRPLLYAISHQLILLPLTAYAVVIHDPSLMSSPTTLFYGLAVLGSFFSYEICRKLDPNAHELQTTYLSNYGPTRTTLLVLVMNLIAAAGAYGLALKALLWPIEILTVLSLIVLFKAPDKYKVGEGMATLSLLFHIWGVSFAFAFYSLKAVMA